jgi:hypothetical protein
LTVEKEMIMFPFRLSWNLRRKGARELIRYI